MKHQLPIVLSLLITVCPAGCGPGGASSEREAPMENGRGTSPDTTTATGQADQTTGLVAEPARTGDRDIALAARDELFKRLSTRLTAAMGSGGPAAAIEVCRREAPKIANAVGQEMGVAIGRTSFRLRNPQNKPPSWATSMIEQRVDTPQFLELADGGTAALFPIKLQAQCLVCHGPAEQISGDVKSTLAELYSEDQATGFKEGELRGWFWVQVPAAVTRAEGSEATAADTAESAVLGAFAQFDQVYIPALALSNQGQDAPARRAMQRLAQRWTELRPTLTSAIRLDSWPQTIETVEGAIKDSMEQADQGDLAGAHETLEQVRDLMMAGRQSQGLTYDLDLLSMFHATMEEIVKPAMKLTPETLTEEITAQWSDFCQRADEQWQRVEATDFDLSLFGIDSSRAKALQQFIQAEREAIGRLQSALQSDDAEAIITAARGLKPPFARTYMFFGDFPQRSQTP